MPNFQKTRTLLLSCCYYSSMVRAIVGYLMKGQISKYINNSSLLCRNGYSNGGVGLNFITEKRGNFRFFLHGGN